MKKKINTNILLHYSSCMHIFPALHNLLIDTLSRSIHALILVPIVKCSTLKRQLQLPDPHSAWPSTHHNVPQIPSAHRHKHSAHLVVAVVGPSIPAQSILPNRPVSPSLFSSFQRHLWLRVAFVLLGSWIVGLLVVYLSCSPRRI